MRGRRSVILGATAALMAGGAPACAAAATSSPTLALAALRSVPASSATLRMIEINNLAAIERAAGASTPPTARQLRSRAFAGVIAQLIGGSDVGSGLWGGAGGRSAPLGYPVLALREELAVGAGMGAALGEAWGPISPSAVAASVRSSHPRTTVVGRDRLFDFGRVFDPTRPGPAADVLGDTRFLAVPDAGGRIVGGGRAWPESPVLDLASGRPVAHSVAALAQVAAMQRAFGARVQSEAMGTDLITAPAVYAERLPPARLKRILRQTGLSRLPRPLIVGLAYTAGGPRTQTVVTATVYRSAAAARIAEPIIARATGTGISAKFNVPNSRLWRVEAARTQGDVVVMRLLTRSAAATDSVQNFDFPPFWR